MVMERLVIWRGLDGARWEAALFEMTRNGVTARGTQIAVDPVPYQLDYRLEAPDNFVTRLLDVRVRGAGWSRSLVLRHDGHGQWDWESEKQGEVKLDPPGGDPELASQLIDAVDCDLGLSPVTNLMPIRRHGLNVDDGTADIVVAWVSVPDLKLYSYDQRYESIHRSGEGSLVRFIDRGLSEGFVADLELDADGLIEVYPELAERVS
jgi:uncharacterized protein